MQIEQIMSPDPMSVAGSDTLAEALAIMDELDIRHLPVLRNDQVVGVVSDRDLLEWTGWMWDEERGKPPVNVEDVFQTEPLTVGPDDAVAYLAAKLVEWAVGCAPVVEHGRLLGIVTESDVLRAYAAARDSGGLAGSQCPTVEKRMTAEVYTLDMDSTLEEARTVMRECGIRHLPVVDELKVLGMLSDRDLRVALGRALPANTPVREIMSPEVQLVSPETDLSRAARKMGDLKIGSLAVVEHGDLIGILTVTDVLEHCATVLG